MILISNKERDELLKKFSIGSVWYDAFYKDKMTVLQYADEGVWMCAESDHSKVCYPFESLTSKKFII